MSDLTLLKDKYLTIATQGLFASYDPAKLTDTHRQVESFLALNSESIDTLELFTLYELQFYLSILTNHDIEAKSYLDRIMDQFGSKRSQRVKLLQSVYLEAVGQTTEALKLLGTDPDELRLSRRMTTFSRNLDSNQEYIDSLIFYLDLQPSDLVTWAELADEYSKIGHYDKAIFCLKEILLQEPYAYNVFYKVGLFYYYQFLQKFDEGKDRKEWAGIVKNARDSFLRAVEIAGDYGKGWTGVYLVTLSEVGAKVDLDEEDRQLHELSITKLMSIHNVERAQVDNVIKA